MIDDGLSAGGIGMVRVGDARVAGSAVRRGLLTGALVGTATGVLLEGTVLAFPHAAIFVAGGTLAAALGDTAWRAVRQARTSVSESEEAQRG